MTLRCDSCALMGSVLCLDPTALACARWRSPDATTPSASPSPDAAAATARAARLSAWTPTSEERTR